jgi:16S rRNA (guanine(966)-N(2))-methyltransferase RsmD
MRVISGVAKGRSLKAPFGASVLRPTSDKVREAIFDIIGPEIEDSTFLDLFCGTGAMGIEALSRGAHHVVFVDNKSSSIDLVKDNLSKCSFKQNFEIIQCDVLQAIQSLSNRQRKFRYIFIDPPYSSNLIVKTLEAISMGGLLLPRPSVLVEHSVKKPVPEKAGDLITQKEYKFGDTVINSYHCIEV